MMRNVGDDYYDIEIEDDDAGIECRYTKKQNAINIVVRH